MFALILCLEKTSFYYYSFNSRKFFQFSTLCGTYDKQVLCGVLGLQGSKSSALCIHMGWRYKMQQAQIESWFVSAALFISKTSCMQECRRFRFVGLDFLCVLYTLRLYSKKIQAIKSNKVKNNSNFLTQCPNGKQRLIRFSLNCLNFLP